MLPTLEKKVSDLLPTSGEKKKRKKDLHLKLVSVKFKISVCYRKS